MEQLGIDVTSPFVIYASCEVEYKGRAESTLGLGNYLIIKKEDGSFLVHGSTKCPPLNYQGPKTNVVYVDDTLIATNKKEFIKVRIKNLIEKIQILSWSTGSVNLIKSESDLIKIFVDNPEKYLGWKPKNVELEYNTAYGPVDVMCENDLGEINIIEFKRHKISINHCVQLRKYIEGLKQEAKGYLAAPAINKNAQEYCDTYGFKFIEIGYN